jgi:maltooligosyltrehalose trehalohydrolase
MKTMTLGAAPLDSGKCRFLVYAPEVQRIEVHVLAPEEKILPLKKEDRGYHGAELDGVPPGSLYLYRLDGERERPDPASRFQPQGVHGPSQVVSSAFPWRAEDWRGLPLEAYVLYELHVGTFTEEGTFEAIIPRLDALKALGVTAVELMPVSQFPGGRNWGYDGVYPFAAQESYGGPEGLRRLVDACHARGMAVVLDVVYNHLGPEGNYLWDFGPYFTDRYQTPWGSAVNFDGPFSDEVRRFFIASALYWITDCRVDALRIDAVHAIKDFSAVPFLADLSAAVKERARMSDRRIHLIAESDLNDTRLVRPRSRGGYGLDALWNDDFHHALHALLTGERSGYYQDYGRIQDLAKACREGFVLSDDYSRYRRRRHGHSSRDIPAGRFVVFAQNHDQVGNRMRGERLSALASFEQLKLAAGTVLLSPFVPLLFMGEEYGETAPFLYFVSHSDPDLVEAVRQGRRREFRDFQEEGGPPDPQDEATFRLSMPDPSLAREGRHAALLAFHRECLALRRRLKALHTLSKECMEVWDSGEAEVLAVRRSSDQDETVLVAHFGGKSKTADVPLPEGPWKKVLDSSDARWEGPGSGTIPHDLASTGRVALDLPPHACVLFHRERESG